MSDLIIVLDIGANLLDEMFQGVYHEKKAHEPDLDLALDRSTSRARPSPSSSTAF